MPLLLKTCEKKEGKEKFDEEEEERRKEEEAEEEEDEVKEEENEGNSLMTLVSMQSSGKLMSVYSLL